MSLKRRSLLYFIPTVFYWGLPLFMLPLTTYVLEPDDYGHFALVTAVTAFGATLAPLASTYILCNKHGNVDGQEWNCYISVILEVGSVILALFVIAVAAWHVMGGWLAVRGLELAMALASMVFIFPWTITNDILTLEGRAGFYAKVTIGQSLVAATTMLTSLYVFKLGRISIFLSDMAGSLFCFLCAAFLLRKYFTFCLDRGRIQEVISTGFIMSRTNLVGILQMNLERHLVAWFLGITWLGLYEHAKRYRQMVGNLIGSIGRSVWPVALQEAAQEDHRFFRTIRIWNALYLGAALVGLVFAVIGDVIIGFLTHGKFTKAASLAPFWIIWLIMQGMQRPQHASMYVKGHGKAFANNHLFSILLNIVLMLILIPTIGPMGGVLSFLIMEMAFRFSLFRFCQRKDMAPIPYADQWAWAGILLILIGSMAFFLFREAVITRFVILAVMMIMAVVINRTVVAQVFPIMRRVPWFGATTPI